MSPLAFWATLAVMLAIGVTCYLIIMGEDDDEQSRIEETKEES